MGFCARVCQCYFSAMCCDKSKERETYHRVVLVSEPENLLGRIKFFLILLACYAEVN